MFLIFFSGSMGQEFPPGSKKVSVRLAMKQLPLWPNPFSISSDKGVGANA